MKLDPLIAKGGNLKKFVEEFTAQERDEVNLKDINQKFEQISYKIKELSSAQDRELVTFGERVTEIESAIQSTREEMRELSMMPQMKRGRSTAYAQGPMTGTGDPNTPMGAGRRESGMVQMFDAFKGN